METDELKLEINDGQRDHLKDSLEDTSEQQSMKEGLVSDRQGARPTESSFRTEYDEASSSVSETSQSEIMKKEIKVQSGKVASQTKSIIRTEEKKSEVRIDLKKVVEFDIDNHRSSCLDETNGQKVNDIGEDNKLITAKQLEPTPKILKSERSGSLNQRSSRSLKSFDQKSFFLFSQDSKVRQACIAAVQSK